MGQILVLSEYLRPLIRRRVSKSRFVHLLARFTHSMVLWADIWREITLTKTVFIHSTKMLKTRRRRYPITFSIER